MSKLSSSATYEEKFEALNQQQRWEVADELKRAYLSQTNAQQSLVSPTNSSYSRYGKRIFDIAASSAALLVTAPVNVALAALVARDLGRPVVFKQQRIGKNGKQFQMIKLKTMRDGFDEDGRPILGEKRVTKLGKVLRRTSADELLNFWSIFKGDMSLIGPRPLVPEYLERFSARHKQRLCAKPGLDFPPPTPVPGPMGYDEQFENDVWYVQNISLKTDLWLIWRTLQSVFDSQSSGKRAASARGSFLGYDEHGQVVTTDTIPLWALDKVLQRHGLLDSLGDETEEQVTK